MLHFNIIISKFGDSGLIRSRVFRKHILFNIAKKYILRNQNCKKIYFKESELQLYISLSGDNRIFKFRLYIQNCEILNEVFLN